MPKAPWKKNKKSIRPAEPPPIAGATPPIEPAPEAPPAMPPPLPPFGAAEEAVKPKVSADFEEARIKAGLGKAFCSMTAGAGRIANYTLRNSPYRVEVAEVTPEEGDFWAEFALPVLKMYMPNLEQKPITTLCVMTGLLLSGKIIIVKKTGGNHDGTTTRTEDTSQA